MEPDGPQGGEFQGSGATTEKALHEGHTAYLLWLMAPPAECSAWEG